MFTVTALDEAPVRRLTPDELFARNKGLHMYVQPAKEGSQWAIVGATQYSHRHALASRADFDAAHGLDAYGRSIFDTSFIEGRRALSDLVADFMGFPRDVELRERFAEYLLIPEKVLRPRTLDTKAAIKWFENVRRDAPAPATHITLNYGPAGKEPFDIRTVDLAREERLTQTDLENRFRGMLLDYERTSRRDDPAHTGNYTILRGGRQLRFEGVRWPSEGYVGLNDSTAIITAISDVLGLDKVDRSLFEPLLRRRFEAIAPLRQVFYRVETDMEWLLRSRSGPPDAERPALTHDVLRENLFLSEPGEGSSDLSCGDQGGLPAAAAPAYRIVDAGQFRSAEFTFH